MKNPRFVHRKVGEESVIVPTATSAVELDSIFALNEVATFIWERLDGKTATAEILEAVIGAFDVSREVAAADLEELVHTLREIDAVRPV